MSRPDTITEADIAEWLRKMQASEYAGFASIPIMCEVWYAGEWLCREMLAAGATEEEADRVGFAAGQWAFGQPDPWPAFQSALEKWKAGNPDRPGPELAERLMRGHTKATNR